MQKSTITIDVHLDDNKVPGQINWNATDSSAENTQQAKAMLVSFWDGRDKTALKLDLWTKDMMMDEMADFYYQTLVTMSETFERATKQKELANDMKKFAKEFYEKFRDSQMQTNKLV